jgi:hypothetical protein
MARVHIGFDRTLQTPVREIRAPEAKLPFRLALPVIVGLSLGMWAALWKLGSFAIGLAGLG